MNEYSKILNASKKEFVDKKNNATVTLSSYFSAKNGLGYILLGEASKKVSVDIHLTAQQEQTTEGNYDTGSVLITSQADLYEMFDSQGNIFVMEYKKLKLIINRSYNYNEVAQTYHYTGEILQNRNKQFVILNESEASELFLTNSTILWLEFGKRHGFNIYPSFLTPNNLEEPYFTVEITNTKALSGMGYSTEEEGKIQQYLGDEVHLTAVNCTMRDAQGFLWQLIDSSTQGEFFGLNDWGAWVQSHFDRQKGFGIKANINTMDIKINYYTMSGIDDVIRYIRNASINLTIEGE